MKESIVSNEMLDKNHKAINLGVEKLGLILWDAQNYRLHELHDNAKDKEVDRSDREPSEFLHVMGEVLSNYQGRLAWRLGVKQGRRVKNAMKKIEEEGNK